MNNDLFEGVLQIISSYTGKPPETIDVDAKIGADIGLNGGDSVQFLDEIEERFGADLSPLIEKHKKPNKRGFLRMLFRMEPDYSSDFTVRQLVKFISELR